MYVINMINPAFSALEPSKIKIMAKSCHGKSEQNFEFSFEWTRLLVNFTGNKTLIMFDLGMNEKIL